MKKLERGQSIVEWCIILPFLLLILISILELAPLMNSFLKMEKACQYGARVGAIHGNTNDEVKDAVLFNSQGLIDNAKLTSVPLYDSPLHATKVAGYREMTDGKETAYIEIVPGELEKRINGGWVMVKVTYKHKIFTPLLRTVLDVAGFLEDGHFPVMRYAIYRIE